MAYGSKTASGVALLLGCGTLLGQYQFEVTHDHLYKSCRGTMVVNEQGIAYHGPKRHDWNWPYQEIQELRLAPGKIRIRSYRDRKLLLGADQEYTFRGDVPQALFAMWSKRLDQRFVAELAERRPEAGWSLPVKHLRRAGGTQGELRFLPGRIVFMADREDQSRTWRFSDIAGISSSGPFQLTITTYEHARMHYGGRKGFNFQLKQALDEARYNQLWRQIHQENGSIQ